MQLLLGCGFSRVKVVGMDVEFHDLVTVDINPDCHPDIIHDLNAIPLPFADNSADEIHIYNCLEHLGTQGDYKFFFRQFEDFWRILKCGGVLYGTVPHWESMWLWGDPGHTRMISAGTLSFLDQNAYLELGNTMRTDYRYLYSGDLKLIYNKNDGNTLTFALVAAK